MCMLEHHSLSTVLASAFLHSIQALFLSRQVIEMVGSFAVSAAGADACPFSLECANDYREQLMQVSKWLQANTVQQVHHASVSSLQLASVRSPTGCMPELALACAGCRSANSSSMRRMRTCLSVSLVCANTEAAV